MYRPHSNHRLIQPHLAQARTSSTSSRRDMLIGRGSALTALVMGLGLGACGNEAPDGGGGSGGTTTAGGSSGTSGAGSAARGGTGGSTAGTGGASGSGGSGAVAGGSATGGTAGSSAGMGAGMGTGGPLVAGSGGTPANGGAGAMAGEGAGMGGRGGDSSGGAGSGAGGREAGGGAGMGAGASGGTGGGTCARGMTKGSEVAVIGESFIAATHGITQEIEKKAKAAGSLAENEHYVDNSVSGTTLANDQIPSQYTKAVMSSGTIKYVLMDGGGNDCLLNNNGDAALTAATSLFQTMAQNDTEKVLYFFYPDPIGSNFDSLKSCLDALRPKMKALCDGLTAPKCYWLDLRDVWNGHNEYTSDGIHPTTAGSNATGDAVWEAMQANCVAP